MVELGIGWQLRDDPYPSDPKITWALVDDKSYSQNWIVPNNIKNVIWENPYELGLDSNDRSWYSDVNVIKAQFNLLIANKDKKWTHSTILNMDETYSPCIMVSWGWASLTNFILDGEITLPNDTTLKGIKPWYIAKYGSWNQKWWDDIVAGNLYRDTILLDWNFNEWTSKIYKAWYDLVHSWSKYTCHVGFINTDSQYVNINSLVWNWGSQLDWLCANIDVIFAYHFPTTILEAQSGIPIINLVRTLVKKKLGWVITIKGNTSSGSSDQAVQFEDYKTAISGKADIILMPAWSEQSIQSEPRLLQFCNDTGTCPPLCQPLECNLTL